MDKQGSHLIERILPLFLAIITAIVVLFLAQMMLEVKQELGELTASVETMRAQPVSGAKFEPFATLEQKCVDCHSERKFMNMHGTEGEITQVLNFMESMPDAHLSVDDMDTIHDSLRLLKCVQCHDEATVKQLGTFSPARQRAIVRRMAKKPGANITSEEAREILRVMQEVQGF